MQASTPPSVPEPPRQPEPSGMVGRMVIVSVFLSLLVGGIAGGIVGAATDSNGLSQWIDRTFFKSAATATVGPSTTLSVEEESATTAVVKKASPAVVSVIGTKDFGKVYQAPFNDSFPFNFPFQLQQPEGKREVSGGSGFIVSADGLIVTNKHVVNDETIEYSVVLNDETRHDARVLAKDPTRDIAILKIDAKDLPTVELGDSEKVEIGQTVIAIGNALGEYRNTVTKGIVSGLARTIEAGDRSGTSEVIENSIQTDTAINPGNSGGPLLNLFGQVVGVNTAINTEGQLVGFAIPVNEVKQDLASVQEKGKIVRPYLGVRYTPITKVLKEQNNLAYDYGVIVVGGDDPSELAVIPGSPADKAGIVENDLILEINGKQITEDHSLIGLLSNYNPGDTVTLKISHRGEEKTIQVTLGERDA